MHRSILFIIILKLLDIFYTHIIFGCKMIKLSKTALASILTLSLLVPIALSVTQYKIYMATFGDGSITLNPGGTFTGWDVASFDEGTVIDVTANPGSGW
jgi:hypothetical protein